MQIIAQDAYQHITGGTGDSIACVAERDHRKGGDSEGEPFSPHASSYKGSLRNALKSVIRGAVASAITGTTGLLGAAVVNKLIPK